MRCRLLEVCPVIFVAALLIPLSVPSRAAGGGSSPSPEVVKELQAVAAHLPGLSVAVGDTTGVLWARGFGRADLELGTPVTPETRFLVYSAAKAWTATAGARLAEKGKLGVEQPIGELLDGLPEPLRKITPMQLARHSAGIRHYSGEAEAVSGRHCEAVADALPIFVDDPLLFEPGTDRAYSSWGYVLLSAVLEGASGMEFRELLEQEVFEPTGMELAAHADPRRIIPGRATAYEWAEGSWRNLPFLDVTCKWGAGGFLAAPVDLVRFYRALMAGELVGPELRALILGTGPDGLVRFGGSSAGGQSFVLADPAAGWVVALASNARVGGVDLGVVAERITEAR